MDVFLAQEFKRIHVLTFGQNIKKVRVKYAPDLGERELFGIWNVEIVETENLN